MRAAALLLIVVASPAFAGDATSAPSPPRGAERDALFAWLDGLGFPDVADKPVVRVTYWGGTDPGFLVRDDEETPRVLTIGLLELDAAPVAPDAPAWKRVTFERVDAVVAARDFLAEARGADDNARMSAASGGALTHRARLVVLARRLATGGPPELVDELLGAASVLPGALDWHGVDVGKSLQERVADDVEHACHVRTFGYPMPDDLPAWRDAYATFARRFPDSMHAADASRLADVVARMIVDAPRVPSEEDVAKLDGDALARALVLRLRKLKGAPWSAMGAPPSIFTARAGLAPSDADRLVALGDVAVPALVDAVDDPTLTPLAYEGRTGWNPGVLTVGDCALDVLRTITGEKFCAPAIAKTWWIRKHRDDDVAKLIDRTLAGGADGLVAAKALAAAAPLDAAWVVEAAWNSQVEDLRDVAAPNAWIDLFATVDAPRVADVLDVASRRGYRLTHRVAAAVALERLDRARSLAAARRLAFHLREESHATPGGGRGVRRDLDALCDAENAAAERVIRFVAERGAVDALAPRYARQWPHVRVMIAREVALRSPDVLAPRTSPDAGPNAAERLLLATLDDVETAPDVVDVLPGVRLHDVRPRDAAVAALAKRFGYAFDAARPPSGRDADAAAWKRRMTSGM